MTSIYTCIHKHTSTALSLFTSLVWGKKSQVAIRKGSPPNLISSNS